MRVHYGRKTKNSALALQEALNTAGYTGPSINYGLGHSPEALNKPSAIQNACNKRLALEAMIANRVSCPLYYPPEHGDFIFPVVGRPDKHSKGRGFWLCNNQQDVQTALRGTRIKAAATHFLQYIENAREFRVHVVRDGREEFRSDSSELRIGAERVQSKYRTIKISEKLREVDVTQNSRPTPASHDNGAIFNYTDISNRDRRSLRKAARESVSALELDFGGVDLLLKDGKALVLEVNTAPRLTDETSDTLTKYVNAFMRYWHNVPVTHS